MKMNQVCTFLLAYVLVTASAKRLSERPTSRILGGLESSFSTFSARNIFDTNRNLELSSECLVDQLVVEMDVLQAEDLLLSHFIDDEYYDETTSIPEDCEVSEDKVYMVCDFDNSNFFATSIDSCISSGYKNVFIDLQDECDGNIDDISRMPVCLAQSCDADEYLKLMSMKFDETCYQDATLSDSQELPNNGEESEDSEDKDSNSEETDSTYEMTGGETTFEERYDDNSGKDDTSSTIAVVMIVGAALLGLIVVGKKVLNRSQGETTSFKQATSGQFS